MRRPAQWLPSHHAATRERCASESLVLIVQDTTSFNFTGQAATTGMGPMGSGTEQGFLLHSALALTAEGVPLGWVGVGRLRGHAIGGRLRPAALPFLWQVGMA